MGKKKYRLFTRRTKNNNQILYNLELIFIWEMNFIKPNKHMVRIGIEFRRYLTKVETNYIDLLMRLINSKSANKFKKSCKSSKIKKITHNL